VSPSYAPDRGDLVWLDFDPHSGKEQAGRRPALVLSPAPYNRKTGLAIACPITSQVKGYPFEVPVKSPGGIAGVVLSDHVKSIDWVARNSKRVGATSAETLNAVVGRIARLIGVELP
jgi:mRNA interferase MazF